jgi:hypothetical protein
VDVGVWEAMLAGVVLEGGYQPSLGFNRCELDQAVVLQEPERGEVCRPCMTLLAYSVRLLA